MVKSMTGFGRSEYSDGKRNITVEIKSVNHRYSDITIKMPRRYTFAEEKLKTMVKSVAKRGKIDIYIAVESIEGADMDIKLNTFAATQYYNNLIQLKEIFSLEGDVNLSLLANLPDVMKTMPDIEDEEVILDSLSVPLKDALEKFDDMRITEGKKLAKDILMRGVLISNMADNISLKAHGVAEMYKERLADRISELLGGIIEIPEERIALEAALFADKANVTEELVRLSSHLSQLKKIIEESEQPDGKKLDFLVQEMNREVNTIGSKANNLEITNFVLEMKSEIEKIREQVQNIE